MTTTLIRTERGYRIGDVEVSVNPLSPREAQMAALAAAGIQRAEAAEILGITRNSAQKLSERLYWKLQVNNMLAAVAEARRRGYIRFAVLALLVLAGTHHTQALRAPRPPARTASVVRIVRSGYASA